MRAVLDTNIWFRGVVRAASYPGQVIAAWLTGRLLSSPANRFSIVSPDDDLLSMTVPGLIIVNAYDLVRC